MSPGSTPLLPRRHRVGRNDRRRRRGGRRRASVAVHAGAAIGSREDAIEHQRPFPHDVTGGSYRARAEASPAHGAELFSERPCTSTQCDAAGATPVVVTDGTTTSNINFTLASCSAMTLSPPLLVRRRRRGYRQVLSVNGGVGPSAFGVSEGLLPLGTTLAASTGVLEGTPTVSGRRKFTVGAVDASGCATARAYTLDVQAARSHCRRRVRPCRRQGVRSR